jgi:16S rRNA A1518/A1519 N6-dimethyltransferase RsmA/KsgA/DIM1 with predicted DNA glycosylase/AP lyase activity
MNAEHLELLASDGWRDLLRDIILPWALDGVDLGDEVLEVGPGPGLTTDLLHERVPQLTAVELDESLAADLAQRLAGTNVEVVNHDATAMPFADGHFSGAVSFTMLHHVPTIESRMLIKRMVFAEPGKRVRAYKCCSTHSPIR